MSEKLGVALTRLICPICGKDVENPIILNTELTEKEASKVKELHNKVIGFSNTVCKECAEYKDKAVFLISIDPKLSEEGESPYRTGKVVGVRKNRSLCTKFREDGYINTLPDGTEIVFLADEVGVELNLWDKSTE